MHGELGWPCPNFGGLGGHWYTGEPLPGECAMSTLPIDDGESVPWALDRQHVRDELLGLLEGGGVPTVEQLVEEDEEEEQAGPS